MNKNKFIEEIEKLGIEVTDKKLEQLEKYYELLIEYNKVMNLKGITEQDEVYLKHFYDSLTISKIIDLKEENSLCDLGSGAGFPGIVIKIFYPDLNIKLVDSLNKRINFLNDVIDKIGLNEARAIHFRAEDAGKDKALREKFDIATARAVADLAVLAEYALPFVKVGGYFVAMKGTAPDEELENAKKSNKGNGRQNARG